MNPDMNQNNSKEINQENTQQIPNTVNENTQEIPKEVHQESAQDFSSRLHPDEVSNDTEVLGATAKIPNLEEKKDEPITNEKLKKVEIEYTPLSTGKTVALVLFFILLICFVVFLPQIRTFVEQITSGKISSDDEKIETGQLICSLKSHTATLDKEYDTVFSFTDSKLKKVKFTITTRGDITLDAAVLDELSSNCNKLSTSVNSMPGVNVRCEYTSGKLVEGQSYDLEAVDMRELDSAFSEAGGVNPEYQLDQNIDEVERNLYVSGYSCSRERN